MRKRNVGARPDFEDYCKGPLDWAINILAILVVLLLIFGVILLILVLLFPIAWGFSVLWTWAIS